MVMGQDDSKIDNCKCEARREQQQDVRDAVVMKRNMNLNGHMVEVDVSSRYDHVCQKER